MTISTKKQYTRGIILRPDDVGVDNIEGELKVALTAKRLQVYLDGALRNVVTTNQAQTLENKTIDADVNPISNIEVDNLKAGVLNTSTTLDTASDTQIPSALAVKTYVDDKTAAQNEASEISYAPVGNITSTNVQAMGQELDGFIVAEKTRATTAEALVQTNLDNHANNTSTHGVTSNLVGTLDLQTLVNKHIDADTNTLSNLEVDNLKAGVLNTSPTLADATDNQVPSALAAKSLIVQAMSDFGDALDAETANRVADVNAEEARATAVEASLQTQVNTKVTKAASSTDNAVARFDSTTGALLQNSNVIISDTDVVSGITQLDVDGLRLDSNTLSTTNLVPLTLEPNGLSYVDINGNTILAQGKYFAAVPVDNNSAGPSITVNGKNIRLINPSLTSIDTIVADAYGKEITLINRTGNDIIVNNDTGASVNERIYTGTGGPVTLKKNGAFSFVYDGTTFRWNVIGGTGSGSGGGGGVTDPDTLLIQTFDNATAADFTQAGLTFETVSPLNGAQSAKLTHQSGTSQYFKQTLSVPQKFRGINATFSIVAKSTATKGNVTVSFYDETNGAALGTSEQLNATSTIQEFQFGVAIPSTCLSMSYTVTALQEAGSPVTLVDDIQLRSFWLGTSVQGQSEILVPTVTTQSSVLNQASTFAAATITGVLQKSVGSGLFSYNSSNGVYTVLKAARFNISASFRQVATTRTLAQIVINGISVANSDADISTTQSWATTSTVQDLNVGDSFYLLNGTGQTDTQVISVGATAVENKAVVVNDIVPAKAVSGSSSISIPKITTQTVTMYQLQNAMTAVTNPRFNLNTATKNNSGNSTSIFTIQDDSTLGVTRIVASKACKLSITARGTLATAANNLQIVKSTGGVVGISDDSYVNSSAVEVSTTVDMLAGESVYVVSSGALANGGFTYLTTVSATAFESTTQVIAGTQSGLVQESDIVVKAAGNAGQTVTVDVTDIPFVTVSDSVGAWNGSTFIVPEDGIYSITGGIMYTTGATARTPHLYINGTNYKRIGPTLATGTLLFSIQDKFTKGQILSIRSQDAAGTLLNDSKYHYINITKAGALKQVNVNANSKITIPTSELRFEGASSRGSVATAIVKFDTLTKVRGDAFEVVSTAADGTYVRMKKAGLLSVSTSVYKSGALSNVTITKNQTNTTATPTISTQILAQEYTTGTDDLVSLSYTGFVAVDDIIRVSAVAAPSGSIGNVFNLSFQEQEIQVSVSNTLPQFSESDTCLRLSGANGFGSTATTIRRFASILQNIGNDVEYTDSATLGGQFRARTSGIYNISFTEESNANINEISATLRINGTIVAFDQQHYNTADATYKAASTSWSGYLTAGDIVTAGVGTAAYNNGVTSLFTISKVGKPNVTGVDVTPFINIPQPITQSIYKTGGAIAGGAVATGVLTSDTSTGLLSYNSTTGVFTALKKIAFTARFTSIAAGAARVQPVILYASNNGYSTSPSTTGDAATATVTGELSAGQTITFRNDLSAASAHTIDILATATSDQILTAPETFSTDTASLRYASSSEYTLATLANAPVGTFITYTLASGGNIRTQTTTAPTQTTSDMNTSGMLLYTRAYNANSTAAQPACVAIQIGKGLKGKSIDVYKSAGKVMAGGLDAMVANTTVENGVLIKDYNEITGVLLIDAGARAVATTTAANIVFSDATPQAFGYFVINASKNPALTGMNVNRVAARAVQSSAQSIPNNLATTVIYDAAKTYDTNGALNTATGVFTAPESGYFKADGQVLFASKAWTQGQVAIIYLHKNGVMQKVSQWNCQTTHTLNVSASISDTIYLAKGDTLTLVIFQNTGTATALHTDATWTNFTIVKVGN